MAQTEMRNDPNICACERTNTLGEPHKMRTAVIATEEVLHKASNSEECAQGGRVGSLLHCCGGRRAG